MLQTAIMLTQQDLHQISLLFERFEKRIDKELKTINSTLTTHGQELKATNTTLATHDQELRTIGTTLASHSQELKTINTTLASHSQELKTINTTLHTQNKELKHHTKQLKQLKKTQDVIIDTLDRTQIRQNQRLDHIESHLGLPALNFR